LATIEEMIVFRGYHEGTTRVEVATATIDNERIEIATRQELRG
jgi:hypothetical protein